MNKKTQFLVQAAVIAAIYAVLTLVFAPISFGAEMVQVRISEALTILPFFTPAAIPGLFIGCMIANLFSPIGPLDVVVGSLASLLAAYLTYKMPRRILAPLPPVVVNALAIGALLHYVLGFPLVLSMAAVAAGQIIACYGLGYPLLLLLSKYRDKVFTR